MSLRRSPLPHRQRRLLLLHIRLPRLVLPPRTFPARFTRLRPLPRRVILLHPQRTPERQQALPVLLIRPPLVDRDAPAAPFLTDALVVELRPAIAPQVDSTAQVRYKAAVTAPSSNATAAGM